MPLAGVATVMPDPNTRFSEHVGSPAVKLYEQIALILRALEVDVVFGLVGDANLYMMDRFQAENGQFVPVANESGALLAAAGYSSVSGRIGVASVTHGPGLANTVNSLYEAVKHRVPSVLISGDTAASDTDNFQDIDQRTLVLATGAEFVQAQSAETAGDDLVAAFHIAFQKRRPVVFNVPIDYQWVDVAGPIPEIAGFASAPVMPSPDDIGNAVGALASARRPVLLAGRGAIAAREDLIALAARIRAPLATTAQARQLFTGEPLDLGIFGGLATPAALEVILESDCVVVFGASLNRWTTAEGSLMRDRTVIHVDHERSAVGRHVQPTVRIHGDAALAARAMLELLDEADIPPTAFGGDGLAARLRRGREMQQDGRAAHRAHELNREHTGARPDGTVDVLLAQWAIEHSFPRPRTLVIDAGRQCMSALGIFSVDHPRDYVHTINFGSIGVGLPYAIGAAIADTSRPTLLLCGDGGFMLGGLTEFNTAVRLGVDLTVVVFNDESFGAEHVQLVRKGLDPAISMFEWPDLADVARALGGFGRTVRSIAELDAVTFQPGTALVNVMTSAQEQSATA